MTITTCKKLLVQSSDLDDSSTFFLNEMSLLHGFRIDKVKIEPTYNITSFNNKITLRDDLGANQVIRSIPSGFYTGEGLKSVLQGVLNAGGGTYTSTSWSITSDPANLDQNNSGPYKVIVSSGGPNFQIVIDNDKYKNSLEEILGFKTFKSGASTYTADVQVKLYNDKFYLCSSFLSGLIKHSLKKSSLNQDIICSIEGASFNSVSFYENKQQEFILIDNEQPYNIESLDFYLRDSNFNIINTHFSLEVSYY